MSLEIREPIWDDNYEDESCAMCGCKNIAGTITSEHVKIFLCEECLGKFKKQIESCQELAARRCEKCVFFRGDKWDWVHYSGRCIKKDRDVSHDFGCDKFEKRYMEMLFKE